MGRATWLADVLADAFRGVKGYRVETYPGWETRGRASGFNPFHDAHGGVLNHHTGRGRFDPLLRYMAENSKIAPLCHWSTSRPENGVVRIAVVSAGRANHAGKGGAGRGGTPWVPTNHGNSYLVGNENQNDGAQPWPDQQVEAIHIATAAVLRHLGHGVDRAIDHKNYAPNRKVDRHSVQLKTEQAAIAKRLSGGGGGSADDPGSQEEEDMAVIIKGKDTGHWYISDGVTKRHLHDADEAVAWAWLGARHDGDPEDLGDVKPFEREQEFVDRIVEIRHPE